MEESDCTILVIDDLAMARHTLRIYLTEMCHYSVIEAESGNQALQVFASKMPDLMVVDYSLGDMTGLQLLAKLRELENRRADFVKAQKVPVIVISGYDLEEVVLRERHRLEIAGFLHKPLKLRDLGGMIQRVLRGEVESSSEEVKTVLIGDEQDQVREYIRALLTKHGYHVLCVSTAAQTMMILKEADPHFLIFSTTLPDSDPVEFLRKIKQMKSELGTLAIANTKKKEEERDLRALGVSDYLVKPINSQKLLSMVEGHFSASFPNLERPADQG